VNFITILRMSFLEFRRHAMRSILTTLGIIIGVAAVIIMVTLGQGATQRITKDIASLGQNLLILVPFQQSTGGPPQAARAFKIADAQAIERDVGGVLAVSPVAVVNTLAVYGGKNVATLVTGTDNGYFRVREWGLAEGRQFSDSDLASGRPVCIVGQTVIDEVYGSQNPIGTQVRLRNVSCEVIGRLAAKGKAAFGADQDNLILMPLAAVQRRLLGNDDISQIFVAATSADVTTRVQNDIVSLLRERRRVPNGEPDDFTVRDVSEITSIISTTTSILIAFLSAIAGISLLVGGIGIMNIMLVSVTERTREIGIRMAIGAQERDVLLQFLMEAVLLCCAGGLIGTLLGLGISLAASIALGVPFVFDPTIVLVAFAFSSLVGVAFGFFPARRAARLDPIEALRHE
jgi:putative ABC transport system permease protein